MTRRLLAGRHLAWTICAATVLLAVAHAVVFYQDGSRVLDERRQLQNFPLITLAALVGVTVGALVVHRRPRHVVGWLFVVGYALTGLGVVAADYGKLAAPGAATTSQHVGNWLGNVAGARLVIPIFCFIALLFPDGRLPSPRWRIAGWVNGVNLAATVVLVGITTGRPTRAVSEAYLDIGGALLVGLTVSFFVIVVMMVVATASLVVRLRSATGDRRRQVLWLLVAAAYLAVGVAGIGVRDALATVGVPYWPTQLVLFLGPSAIPLAAGVAIFRYRLYDIDVVVNRALVLGALVGFGALAYVVLVVGAGSLIGRRSDADLGLTLLATATVALLFQPLYRQVHRWADLVVYGARAAPYEVMAHLADTMADAVSVADVLPRTAAAAVGITGAVAGRARVFLSDGGCQQASWPPGGDPAANNPVPSNPVPSNPVPSNPVGGGPTSGATKVWHHGEVVGDIAVTTPPGRPLSKAQTALLHDLALTSGPALHTVRLTAELRRRVDQVEFQAGELRESRRRIVASRDSERLLLEEDIRARTAPPLATVDDALGEAERFVLTDPARATAALSAAETAATGALEQLRDLAGGVFPALLADRGLVPAIEARLRRGGVTGHVQTDDRPGHGGAATATRYSAATESAIYFCCAEVVESRARVPAPGSLEIRLGDDGQRVRFSVTATEPGGLSGIDERRALRIRDRVEACSGQVRLDDETLAGHLPH